MIFTNADSRNAGRLDDKQGGDTIVTMKRLEESIDFHAELADLSTWLQFTWKQMGFPLRPTGEGDSEYEGRAEDLDTSQRARDYLVAYHLAPAITDVILDEDWEYCNNKFEQTLMMLYNVCSKEIEPTRQNSTHHPLTDSNPIEKKAPVRSLCVEACGGKWPRC